MKVSLKILIRRHRNKNYEKEEKTKTLESKNSPKQYEMTSRRRGQHDESITEVKVPSNMRKKVEDLKNEIMRFASDLRNYNS